MQLMRRLALSAAATVALALPAAALAGAPGDGDYPVASYARGTGIYNACSLLKSAPTGVVLEGFANAAQAKARIGTETGWQSLSPGDLHLKMQDVAGNSASAHCEGETNGRAGPTNSNGLRTYVPLWNNANTGVVAGAPSRQEQTTSGYCGASAGNPVWVTRPNGYNAGRSGLATAFQSTVVQGPYPVEEVNWGNTATITQCNLTTADSNGGVLIIHPKDELGIHMGLGQNSPVLTNAAQTRRVPGCGSAPEDQVPSSAPQSPVKIKQSWIDLFHNAGANATRFGMNWATVAQCTAATEGDWYWGWWDSILTQLQQQDIRPVIDVVGVPGARPGDPVFRDTSCTLRTGYTATVNTSDTSAGGAMEGWKAFVKGVANHFGGYDFGDGRRIAIEVWNEPNSEKYWGGCDPDASKYVKLLRYAARGLQASSHPNIPLVLGSPAPHQETELGHPNTDPYQDRIEWTQWLDLVFSDPLWSAPVNPGGTTLLKDAVDVVGLHPYRQKQQKDLGELPSDAAVEQLNDAYTREAAHGIDKPIWVTEDGTTISGGPGKGSYVGTDQAPYPGSATDLFLQGFHDYLLYDSLRNAGVPLTVIHASHDFRDEITDSEWGYGVTFNPAWLADHPNHAIGKVAYCNLAQERTAVIPAYPFCY